MTPGLLLYCFQMLRQIVPTPSLSPVVPFCQTLYLYRLAVSMAVPMAEPLTLLSASQSCKTGPWHADNCELCSQFPCCHPVAAPERRRGSIIHRCSLHFHPSHNQYQCDLIRIFHDCTHCTRLCVSSTSSMRYDKPRRNQVMNVACTCIIWCQNFLPLTLPNSDRHV